MKSNMFLLTAGLAATALCSCSQKKVQDRPLNILYIMSDDHS